MAGLLRSFRKLLGVPNDLQLFNAIRAGQVHPSTRITCCGKTDGAGAQVNACMSAMAFADAAGIGYVHTPFSDVAHAEGDANEWAQKWERFFGLGLGETGAGEIDQAKFVALKTFLDRPSTWREENQVIFAQHYHGFCNRYPEAYRPVLARLREKYLAAHKPAAPAPSADIVIAAHIRRGDVSATDAITAERYTEDRYIFNILRDCLTVVNALDLTHHIKIFSEGREEDFDEFAALGCELRIGSDPFETIDGLVDADILVMAKSAFSYVPALLGDAIKLYEPFWTKPMSDWIVLAADGSFDRQALSARLAARQSVKSLKHRF